MLLALPVIASMMMVAMLGDDHSVARHDEWITVRVIDRRPVVMNRTRCWTRGALAVRHAETGQR